jgi:hypothetical protein
MKNKLAIDFIVRLLSEETKKIKKKGNWNYRFNQNIFKKKKTKT